MAKKLNTESELLHAGHTPDKDTLSRAVPIYQTTSYVFPSAQYASDLFDLKRSGNIYTRIMNPTTGILESRLAAMDGGVGAVAVSSGQAAVSIAALTLASAGQNIISTSYLYGGTYNLFHHIFKKFGIEARFVDSSKPENFKKRIDKKTRLIYVESIGNPKNNFDDFEAISKIAHDAGIPFIVDNTVSPYIFKPFDFGADIVVYSLTKFIGGHGTSIGGAIVDSGKFDWSNGNFPEFTNPDPSYHGISFWEQFKIKDASGVKNASYITKARVQLLRDLGPCISPFNSFLFLQGLETLHVRMDRHCENALKVAKWLEAHPYVAWVNYPGLEKHDGHERAKRMLNGRYGAIIGFGIKGGKAAGIKFIDSVKLCSHLANIGDAKTLVIHPGSTTHQQLSKEEQLSTGVTEDYIRLSVGIESVDDIIDDLDSALKKSQKRGK